MAQWTTNGLDLVASVVQTLITYVGIGTGAGTLATPLTAGSSYSALPLNAGLPAALSAGTALTITDGTNTDTAAVVAAGGAAMGATSIPLAAGYIAAFNFAATTTGVAPTPQAADLTLYNETVRVAGPAGVAGAGAGESLNSGYFDGTQPTAIYMQVGYFGGSSASATLNSGTLMQEDIQYWDHTINTESNQYQADSFI